MRTRTTLILILMIDAFGYGRLDFILALTLPTSREFGIDSPQLHLLVQITEAKHAKGKAATELVSFTQFDCSVILDVSSVKCVVGWVETKGVKESGEWYVIDRSPDMCETVFRPPEHAYKDDQ
jgi:hypothetical protein